MFNHCFFNHAQVVGTLIGTEMVICNCFLSMELTGGVKHAVPLKNNQKKQNGMQHREHVVPDKC